MGGRADFRSIRQLRRLVKRGGYGLVHTHTPRTALVATLALVGTGVKIVHHVHSPTRRDTESGWRNRINAMVEEVCGRRASALVAVSRAIGVYLEGLGFSAKRIHVVPNGVPVCEDGVDWRLPVVRWVIGSVALFRPRKGIEVLLEALALIRKDPTAPQFVLRGIGPFETPEYEAAILGQVRALGLESVVEWIGFTDNVPAAMRQLDLFVLPSLYGEGLPMVVLEAMALGLPVVATRVEGIPEALEDGLCGVLADAGDAASLATALQEAMARQGDLGVLANAGRRRQREHYSTESMAAGVAKVYRAVLGGGRS